MVLPLSMVASLPRLFTMRASALVLLALASVYGDSDPYTVGQVAYGATYGGVVTGIDYGYGHVAGYGAIGNRGFYGKREADSEPYTLGQVALGLPVRRSNNLRIMRSNTSAVVTSLMCFLTLCMDPFLTGLYVDGVNNVLASLLRDLASVFLGVLVALLLLLVLTVRTTGVSLVSSLTLDIVTISITISLLMSINNLRLSFDNVRVVVDLFMLLGTMCNDNILTLLNFSYIYNDIIVNIAFFMILLLRSLVTLVILLIMTMRTIMISMAKMMTTRVSCTVDKRGREEDNQELHF